MVRALRILIVAAAVLFAQHAAMLHGLAHAQHDIALAAKGGKAPALGHSADVCAAFGALAQAIGGCAAAFAVETATVAVAAPVLRDHGSLTRVVFDPRAPPSFS